jgi:hypothetical protein
MADRASEKTGVPRTDRQTSHVSAWQAEIDAMPLSPLLISH